MDYQYYIKPILYLSFLITLACLLVRKDESNDSCIFLFSIISGIINAAYFGLRDMSVGNDTYNYVTFFDTLNTLYSYDFEIGFVYLSKIIKFISSDSVFFLVSINLIIIWLMLIFVKNESFIFKTFFILTIICYPHFVNLNENVIRVGVSIALVMCALRFAEERKIIMWFLIGLTSYSIHSTGLMFIMFLPFITRRVKLSNYLIGWLICLIVGILDLASLINITGSSMTITKMNTYLSLENINNYRVGFRLDFFIFSVIPIAISFYLLKKNKLSEKCDFFLKSYLALNSVYFIFMNVPFADRFALTSWMLIPWFIVNFVYKNREIHSAYVLVLILCLMVFV